MKNNSDLMSSKRLKILKMKERLARLKDEFTVNTEVHAVCLKTKRVELNCEIKKKEDVIDASSNEIVKSKEYGTKVKGLISFHNDRIAKIQEDMEKSKEAFDSYRRKHAQEIKKLKREIKEVVAENNMLTDNVDVLTGKVDVLTDKVKNKVKLFVI